jgi:hypothetical protein
VFITDRGRPEPSLPGAVPRCVFSHLEQLEHEPERRIQLAHFLGAEPPGEVPQPPDINTGHLVNNNAGPDSVHVDLRTPRGSAR